MAFNLLTELDALTDELLREKVDYAVCGGLALALHGYPRATMDIDLLVTAGRVDDARRIAISLGFDVPGRKMTFGLRVGKPHEVQRVSKLDPVSGEMLSLDLLVVNEVLEQVWRDRVEVDIGSRRITAVSRDGLIAMKRLAGRPKDLLDIATLEGTAEGPDGEAE